MSPDLCEADVTSQGRLGAMRLPDAWVVAAVAGCLGMAVGGGITAIEAASRPWRAGDVRASIAPPAGPSPVAEASETTYGFGTVTVGGKGSHDFVIRNAGDAPLELTKGATSCSCTVADFEESEGGSTRAKIVAPGDTATLKVQWKGKGEGPFRQQASVLTNDPRRPQISFVVEGAVVPGMFKLVPPALTLPKISTGTGERATARIFTFGEAPPEVTSLTLADDKTAQLYSLSSAPLGPADLAAERGATGGLLVTADIRPGLPIGPLRQTIKVVITTPEESVVEIPVEGSVAGDLALAGQAWDSSQEALKLGTVSSRTGSRTSLFLTAKGPHRSAVHPVVRETVPESLQVVVDEGKPVGSGNVMRFQLSITIPPGSGPANHIGTTQAPAGRIVLDTGHPDSPTLTIPVCVAIGP